MRLREELPEFSRTTQWMNGNVTKLNLIGEVPILVHFWSVSCHVCEGAFKIINDWKRIYGDKFKLVGVHMPRSKEDVNNRLIQAKAFQMNMTNPICLDHNLEITQKYQNRVVPTYYLFDKQGLLRHIQIGELGLKMLEKRLVLLMNESKKY
ncbi:TlpA disulfide reductase family protein [Psychrobacillus sp. FSL H8-0483]|uniref:TlpA family protein disulfide reductase n=1 Tax=Psychrobacillus sp. FSL H8-0483 TaxID=2921389 RepID=UPI00315A6962